MILLVFSSLMSNSQACFVAHPHVGESTVLPPEWIWIFPLCERLAGYY
ncbi:hypothetical protein SCG7086_BN_00180 [Chlamydiales bacterium SCGC AG-110-P3]|nr:hypothetical protein SCG7086_BN_00180 [Chlamydiales bacterium SCGC AG-110-P3]